VLDGNMISHIQTLVPAHDFSFRGGMGDSDPGPLRGSAGNDPVEPLAHPRLQQQRGRRLSHLPLDFGRVVLLLRAVPRQFGKLVVAVR
jgi:hypothetical protein